VHGHPARDGNGWKHTVSPGWTQYGPADRAFVAELSSDMTSPALLERAGLAAEQGETKPCILLDQPQPCDTIQNEAKLYIKVPPFVLIVGTFRIVFFSCRSVSTSQRFLSSVFPLMT